MANHRCHPRRVSLMACALLGLLACPLKTQNDYDRSCTVDGDCVLLSGYCGCPSGAMNQRERAHAEVDYLERVLPVVFMIDCGVAPPCPLQNAQALCVAQTCTAVVPDGGVLDGGVSDGGGGHD